MVTISAFRDPVKVQTPIYVVVNLANKTDHDIGFDRLLSGADSKIDVRDLQGNLAPETSFGYVHNGHVAKSELDETRFTGRDLSDHVVGVIVKAGQTATWEINAARFYDMSQAGKYIIRLEMPDPEDSKTILKSNTITVTVTP